MRRLLVACAAIALIGCGGSDSPTEPGVDATGTWDLQTVNGEALPFAYCCPSPSTQKEEILADQFVLSSDGTYTEFFTTRETLGTNAPTQSDDVDTGTWTQSGSQVTLRSDNAINSQLVATISGTGNTINITGQGIDLLYTRQ